MKNKVKKVSLGETLIHGMSVRTNNATEMLGEQGKIGGLYHAFAQQVVLDYENGANLYGVYHHYESDHNGDFSVLVGSAPDKLSTTAKLEPIVLQAGDYLMFSRTGRMPNTVIELWKEIWAYFDDERNNDKRAYTTDFERYIGMDAVEVYIAIQS